MSETRTSAIAEPHDLVGLALRLRHSAAMLQAIDRAEIRVGDMRMFERWIEKRWPIIRDDKLKVAPSFAGVPVKLSTLLPPNRACLLVNDEVKAIIDLDDA